MRTALIHPGALGDLILALPLIQTLAGQGGRVTLFAVGERGRLLAGRSAVAESYPFEDSTLTPWFSDEPPPAGPGPHQGFVRVVCADDDRTLARNLAALLPQARIDRLEVRPAAIERSGVHASEFLHRQLFPDRADVPLPLITPTEQDLRASAEAFPAAGPGPSRPLLLIHPGSGSPAKCWSLPGFVDVAERMRSLGWRVAFVLGEAELEWFGPADHARLAARFPTVARPALSQLAGLMASADACLGNDSGPTHLAAAVGVPTVAIFGPTRPRVWAPRGPAVTVVRGEPAAGRDWNVAPAAVVDRLLKAGA